MPSEHRSGTTPVWAGRPRLPPLRAALGRRRGRVDVAVIGGGVTGCACALRLAESGRTVRLYEAARVGSGASGRNGGFALRGTAVPYDVTVARLGADDARSLMDATERGLERLAALAGDAFRRVGSVRLAADEAELERLDQEYRALARDGFDVARVDRLPPPLDRLYRGALVHPTDGALDPGRWIERLAARAAGAGVEIVEGGAVDVKQAEEEADHVVVATDGATASLLPELAPYVRATRGQMLATAPVAELRYPRPHYARDGFDYWQQLPDGRLVLGGRRDAATDAEYTDADGTTPAVQERLDELLHELVGAAATVTHRWSGFWGSTPDGLPLVGRVPGRGGVWVAGGYSGHGNVLGLVCGELVADAIAGGAAVLPASLDPARFG